MAELQKSDEKVPEVKGTALDAHAAAGRMFVKELQAKQDTSPTTQKTVEVQPIPSKPIRESQDLQPSAVEKPLAQPVFSESNPATQNKQVVSDTSGLKLVTGQGSQIEAQPVKNTPQENISKPSAAVEASPGSHNAIAKSPSQQSFLPESLTGIRKSESDGSLVIPPIRGEHYDTPAKLPSDAPGSRTPQFDAAPHPAPAKMTFGELAAKLNQGDSQQPAVIPQRNLEPAVARPGETIQPAEKSSVFPVNHEAVKEQLNLAEQNQRRDLPATSPLAQTAPAEAARSAANNPQATLQGRISNTPDAPAPIIASRPEVAPGAKNVDAAKLRGEADVKRTDISVTDRSLKIDSGKIETIDVRTTKANDAVTSQSTSGAVKSNRVETVSTDRPTKSDKTDAIKPHDDAKGRTEIGNTSKREPLIIPGVITSRISDNASGSKGSKTDSKPGEKAGQHGETKIAATTSNVINGVAGRIVEGLTNIKDMIIPGAKPNAEVATDKSGSRVEHMDHLTQPKPIDAAPGIGRDLKPLIPAAGTTEFIINGKREITDPREETLSSKAGGLKQALQQIFGNRHDIAEDLKANEFPGPKTIAFENPTRKPDDKQTTRKIDDAAYLRNQKSDKIPTGNLREELFELKNNGVSLEPDKFAADDESIEYDWKNQQKIKDFTVQLEEIAKAANSVSTPEIFAGHQSSIQVDESESDDEEYDSRYLYYVKEGDTLRSIFETQVPHEIGNNGAFEFFIKTNEQTIRLASVLSADGTSLILRLGTVLKLPTPKQIANLRIV